MMAQPVGAQAPPSYVGMSLEELLKIEVTSVSKTSGALSGSAAAVFVITQNDIRRSGATSIPEALRMVPGLQVAKIDANKWAVSSRGFNGRYTNKLQVLIDGRSVYTPLFSGVFWDVQDTVLEDIERIEVIRGPGATLWGANAVNGVINIITRSARDTDGGLFSVAAGSEDRAIGALRYGAPVSENAHLRVYAKYLARDDGELFEDSLENDGWDMLRGGFRYDAELKANGKLTLQGDLYDGTSGQTDAFAIPDFPYADVRKTDADVRGGNLLGRWTRKHADASQTALQLYYDYTLRDDEGTVKERRNTVDVDLQHNFTLGHGHRFVIGGGLRVTDDHLQQTNANLSVASDDNTDYLYNFFAQADFELIPERLRLILGTKLEHNDYTGLELQPNLRLLWQASENHTLWAAVSRAVRSPSRMENDGTLIVYALPPGAANPLPAVLSADGNKDMDSENLMAWEAGFRSKLRDNLSLDVAAFYNQYTDHRTGEALAPQLQISPAYSPYLLVPNRVDNKSEADAYGIEVAADWLVNEWCRIIAAYSYLDVDYDLDSDSNDTGSAYLIEKSSPRNQFSMRTQLNLTRDLELDLWLRYVDELKNRDVGDYTTLDVRFAYRPMENLELSLVGQNLLDPQHPEFTPEFQLLPTEVERAVYAKVEWRF